MQAALLLHTNGDNEMHIKLTITILCFCPLAKTQEVEKVIISTSQYNKIVRAFSFPPLFQDSFAR